MFFDIGTLELVVLLILAVLIFGPEKLPKVIQDTAAFLRKIRQFSDSAKNDIRAELGPEFKDFEFEDLNPKNFARKHLLNNDDLKEIRKEFDLRGEISEITDAVKSLEGDLADRPQRTGGTSGTGSRTGGDLLAKRPDPLAKKETPTTGDTPPPFDADAT